MSEAQESESIEAILKSRFGLTMDDAIAVGADVLDEKVARAADAGIHIGDRTDQLSGLLEKLSQPDTIAMLKQFVDMLPRLMNLLKVVDELPQLAAMAGDVLDERQRGFAAEGIDVEKALTHGLQAALWLGTNVDQEHLKRLGGLLGSEILNEHAVNVVDNAARSLNNAQASTCGDTTGERVGFFGLLKAMRDPRVQRSLAFAIEFGKCFGDNLEQSPPQPKVNNV